MALIVEDGSIVPGANSYVDLTEARAIAEQLALVLPADDTDAEKVLIQGTWYIEGFCFKGNYVSQDQSLAFPRSDLYVKGSKFPDDQIPEDIKRAQVAAADGYNRGAETNTVNDGKEIKKEKIDVLEVEYFQNGKTSSGSIITFANSFLRPYILSSRFKQVVRC